MKNNEFDDVNDANDSAVESGGDFGGGFNEADSFDAFDAPAKGNTIGDLWRENPLVKFAAVGIGVVAVIVLISLVGGGGDAPKSSVGAALDHSEAPGGDTTEAYRDAIQDVNEQRLERALREGSSSIPIPTAGTTTSADTGVREEPPVTLDDPLANWRAAAQAPAQEAEVIDTREGISSGGPYVPGRTEVTETPQAYGPSPEAVEALSTAISQQMQAILGAHEIRAPRVMTITTAEFLEKMNQKNAPNTIGGGASTDTAEVEEILIPAGTIVYAQMLTEANTDAPGPVLVRISSGALNGSRMLGSFSNTERFLTLTFRTVVVDGISHAVDAVAIDPKTTLPAVATEVNRRYFSRFLLPAAANFIEGFSSAIAQRESTTVIVDGSTITSSKPELNTREELAAGLEAGTRVIARDMEEAGDRIQPMIKVHAGTPIGILFLEPVIKPK